MVRRHWFRFWTVFSTSSPRQPSSPGDTTSDATIKSSSADAATMDPRQAILHAESASALVDILRGQYQPPNPSAELAQLRVDQHSPEASNASYQKRLGSALDQVAQLKLQLETSERECHLWKREVDKSVGLITSLRKTLTASGAERKQARTAQSAEVTVTRSAPLHEAELMVKGRDEEIAALSKSIVERGEAYKILQGVSAKHFQQLQEIVLSPDDDGSHKLRHAKKTIDEMRETILRQKRVMSRQGFVPMHDPHMAAAAGAGLDVSGLDPASLKFNDRLCRLLAKRFPEVMRIPDGEDRVVELRICSRQSGSAGSQVSASCSAATPAPGSSSAGSQIPLRHRPPRSIDALRRVRKDKLTLSQRLRVLANPESATAAADSAVNASTAASDASAGPASTTAKLSRLAQLFGSEDESDSGDSDSADELHTPVVTSPGPPQGEVQSYLAAGQVPPGPPPASASAGPSPISLSPTKKHRKGKKKHKHKHKHKTKAKHKDRRKSKR
ncbi:hypothetical protein PHPALM_28467 [Phytophthora palmivora]|uniref:Uncharacterized protein n=1 Tax=Phytophthora palmivora TaxID=4796 RepID=A0A2P4XA17_9STRA|nr:hypothetical protein PHPALM_28467 [Phytophthora palmivora]